MGTQGCDMTEFYGQSRSRSGVVTSYEVVRNPRFPLPPHHRSFWVKLGKRSVALSHKAPIPHSPRVPLPPNPL